MGDRHIFCFSGVFGSAGCFDAGLFGVAGTAFSDCENGLGLDKAIPIVYITYMRQISLFITDKQFIKLHKLKDKTEVTVSEMIRRAIEEYLRDKNTLEKGKHE